jgi:hypothetical protein
MSDLTITEGGVTVTKVTGGEFLSGDKKLNQMKIDLIDVAVAPDAGNTGAMIAGDLLFLVTEIPNAVATKGGSAILQSVVAISSGTVVTGGFDIVLTSDSTALVDESGNAEPNDAVTASPDIDSPLSVIDGTLGIINFPSLTTVSTLAAVGHKQNIGMVCKAASDTRSLYVWGIVQNTTDYNEGVITLRFGFVQD